MDGASIPLAPAYQPATPWLAGRRWDLTWLVGSALIVPLVLLCVWSGAPAVWINLGVTALIGGPHLFATYLATYGDPRFRGRHRYFLLAATVLVPAFVVYWTLTDFQVLLSVFLFAASAHVLHQNAFLIDVYRRKAAHSEPRWFRWIDYGLLMLCIYPIAAYKLVHSDFYLGKVEILLPSFLKTPVTYWTVWLSFGLCAAAWLAKTAWEWGHGRGNFPRTLLVAATCLVAFWAPAAASGERMELAFQAVNAWHSLQYLAVVWLVLHLRRQRGWLTSPLVRRFAGPGRASVWFYGVCLAITLALMAAILALQAVDPLHLSFDQYYYMAVLSCLLIHYVLDAYLFAASPRPGSSPEQVPYAVVAL